MASSGSIGQTIAQWRPWQFVLAGMGVILAVSTVTIVTSIILQPTDIYFSVADFSIIFTNQTKPSCQAVEAEDNSVVAVFNLTAYNPSHRAGVVYRYVLVSMQLQDNGKPRVRQTSVSACVTDDLMKLHQGTNSNRTMGVEATVDSRFYRFYGRDPSATITIFAQAQFRVGLARSRVYNIRVKCSRINIVTHGARPGTANCSALI